MVLCGVATEGNGLVELAVAIGALASWTDGCFVAEGRGVFAGESSELGIDAVSTAGAIGFGDLLLAI